MIDSDPAREFCFQSIILVSERLDLGTIYNEKGMNIKGQRNEEENDNNLLFLVCLCKKMWTEILTKYWSNREVLVICAAQDELQTMRAMVVCKDFTISKEMECYSY